MSSPWWFKSKLSSWTLLWLLVLYQGGKLHSGKYTKVELLEWAREKPVEESPQFLSLLPF